MNGILLDNSTDSSFFLLTPLDHTPYTCRRIGMSYQVEELVVPAFAHVAGSGIAVEDGTSDSITNIIALETINIMNIYNFKLEIFNVCMFIIISL
jgi:hypothetical protein